jgi:hypothetical protein
MNPDELQPSVDPFAAARAMFEAVLAELGSAAMASRTPAQLEDWLAEHQREVTRQALQDLLDHKAPGRRPGYRR